MNLRNTVNEKEKVNYVLMAKRGRREEAKSRGFWRSSK